MFRIKICGITRKEDAFKAVDLGADALGFVFAPSPRKISPPEAKEIIKSLPPFVSTVGVFVEEKKEKVREIADFCGLSLLQFHGEEPPAFCLSFPWRVIKAFQVKDESILKKILLYQGVSGILLDAYSPKRRGGTGKTFSWEIARKAKSFGIPLILSGGLTPSNVGRAIKEVMPYGVDVSSGVEKREGIKDPKKLKSFIREVKEWETYLSQV